MTEREPDLAERCAEKIIDQLSDPGVSSSPDQYVPDHLPGPAAAEVADLIRREVVEPMRKEFTPIRRERDAYGLRLGQARRVLSWVAKKAYEGLLTPKDVDYIKSQLEDIQHESLERVDALEQVERERDAAIAARDEARRFGEDAAAKYNALLKESRVLRCAFCNEAYPDGTPATQHERLTQHVRVCPSHPMREAEAERDEARKDAERLRSMLWMSHAGEEHYRYGDDGEMQCSGEDGYCDFKRAPVDDIQRHIERRGLRLLAAHEKAKG